MILVPKKIKIVDPKDVHKGFWMRRGLTTLEYCLYMKVTRTVSIVGDDSFHVYKKALKKWLRTNPSGRANYVSGTYNKNYRIWVLFEKEEDGMMFRLSWG